MENKYGIILDGRMDEPIWETVETHTGFHKLNTEGGALVEWQTFFKILPVEDRIFVGVKCCENNEMDKVLACRYASNEYNSSSVELFFSPSGTDFEFYQFLVTLNGQMVGRYYSENGNIQPDKYAPEWYSAVYIGEDYWSFEAEIPLTAFYWTDDSRWSDKWLFNMTRNRNIGRGCHYSTWQPMFFGYREPHNFAPFENFPVRPLEDDVCIMSATADITEQDKKGFHGTMTVKTNNAVAADFIFSSDRAENTPVSLQAGSNEFTVPCTFDKEGRPPVELSLTRVSDGKVFKRYYPVLAEYMPIKIKFTLPEYRNNFYPGQDCSKVVGTALSQKAVTLTLEGPGIETTTITPDADGNFCFETPNFEEGDAFLTATIDGYEIKKKIRRLAPTGHTMAWISGGNLVVDGKPQMRRVMYARGYRVGTKCQRRMAADDIHENLDVFKQGGAFQPQDLIKGSEGAGGEATFDQMPSEEMLRKVDEILERAKDKDFTHYYLSDEPECRGLSTVYFRNLYNYIAEKDPYHLLLIASRAAGESVEFADWFETHPYICPYNREDGVRTYLRPFHTLGNYLDDINNLNRPDKCIGFLPTCYASKGASLAYDYPTFEEIVCHTWAAMIHGGKSLWPYAGHDLSDRPALWEGMRYIFSTFEALESYMLFAKRTTLYRTTEAEAMYYDNGDEKMFVLVNFMQYPQTITLDGISGTWHEFRHNRTITGNTFELQPFEVVVGTNVVKDAGIPTYEETLALINEQEYARTHRGNLLFERSDEMTYEYSNAVHFYRYKLFDGIDDDLGTQFRNKGENFLEVNLTKVKPTFQKVRISGYYMDNFQFKVRNGDELTVPAIKEVQTEEFAITILMETPICPDAMRFEFNAEDRTELYEIEVF